MYFPEYFHGIDDALMKFEKSALFEFQNMIRFSIFHYVIAVEIHE